MNDRLHCGRVLTGLNSVAASGGRRHVSVPARDLPQESQLLNSHVADCEVCREKLAMMNAVHDVGDVGQ